MTEDKLIITLLGSIITFFMIGIIVDVANTKSEHEHRMELIEEAKAIYELKMNIEFDQTIKNLNYVTDSLNAEIELELNNN
jgi:hypothetical protein